MEHFVSSTETETQPQTATAPGHAPAVGDSPDGIDPSQLPPDIERIDLSDPEYREHAFERYEELRAKCPVSRAIVTSGQGGADEQAIFNRPLWLVTDYEDGSRPPRPRHNGRDDLGADAGATGTDAGDTSGISAADA